MKRLFSNIKYTATVNLFSLIVSTALILIIPKFIGVEDFGLWQLYILYCSFSALIHLGWIDGFLIRNTKVNNIEGDNSVLKIEFYLLFIYLFFITLIVLPFVSFFEYPSYLKWGVYVNAVIVILRGFLINVLLVKNNFKAYSNVMNSQFVIQILLLFLALTLIKLDIEKLIMIDLLSKSFSLLISLYFNRFFLKGRVFSRNFHYKNQISLVIFEVKRNIKVGISIAIAYVLNYLILGFYRILIERNFGIVFFSEISINLSMINLFLTFISAISIAFFPVLTKLSKEKIGNFMPEISKLFSLVLYIVFLSFYPFSYILSLWLPEYGNAIKLSFMMLPIVLFETKVVLLLINTFKTFGKEKLIVLSYSFSLIMSFLISYLIVEIWTPDDLIIYYSVPVILSCIKFLIMSGILYWSDQIKTFYIFDTLVPLLFIISNLMFTPAYSILIYFPLVISLSLYNKKTFKKISKLKY